VLQQLIRFRRYLPVAVLVVVLVVLYLAAGQFLDLARTLERLERLDPGLAGGVLGCAVLLYGIKAVRWRWYVATAGHVLPWRTALTVYLAGQWFTVARGADLSRVVIALRFGIPYALALAIGAVAGVADFAGLAWGGLLASLWLGEYVLAMLVVTLATTALIWGLGGAGPLGRMVEGELPAKYAGAVQAGRRLLRGRPLTIGLAITAVDVLAGAGVMLLAAWALGLDEVGLARAMAVYALSQVAGGLSMVPMGLGVVEGSGVLLLVGAGVDASLAAAVLVLYRLATLSAQMALGAGGLLALRFLPLPGAPPEPAPQPLPEPS
jgi:glycosyltransferase 2 family protein